jgi:hypothetical protein
MSAHFQNNDRYYQRQGEPKSKGHVRQLFDGTGLSVGLQRLQHHAADGTGARRASPDLRMHWACVDHKAHGQQRDMRLELTKAMFLMRGAITSFRRAGEHDW